MNKLLMILISFFFCFNVAHGEIFLTPGIALGFNPKTDPFLDSTPAVDKYAEFGFYGHLEWHLLGFFGLTAGLGYSSLAGLVDYKFTDLFTTTTVKDIHFTGTSLLASGGARISLLNLKKIRFFAGGGYLTGSLTFNYEENAFPALSSYTTEASSGFQGSYLEAGISYRWNDKNGFQLLGRQRNQTIAKLETLNNQPLKISFTEIGIFYIHRVDLSFFWK